MKREIKLGFRNVWTYSFLILFTLFTMTLLLLQASTRNIEGYTDMTGTMMNMTLYLLPLITLLLGSFSITSEKEDGHWGLLVTYPISSFSFLIGKWLGLAVILLTIVFFSFGFSGVIITIFNQDLNGKTFGLLLVFALLLALAFLSISILIGAIAKNRWHALIWTIAIWFIFIISWPLLMISLLSLLPSYQMIQPTLQFLTILNPAELIRVFTMMRLGAGSAFGADYDQWITWATSDGGLFIFILVFLAIIVVTLFVSSLIWKRGDQYGTQ